MLKGIGVDIVQNSRFEHMAQAVLERILTPYELSLAPHRGKEAYFASRFAAKEALVKALGTGFRGIQPRDINIAEDELGRPYITLGGDKAHLLEGLSVLLSLAHERDYSVAMVVLDGKD